MENEIIALVEERNILQNKLKNMKYHYDYQQRIRERNYKVKESQILIKIELISNKINEKLKIKLP